MIFALAKYIINTQSALLRKHSALEYHAIITAQVHNKPDDFITPSSYCFSSGLRDKLAIENNKLGDAIAIGLSAHAPTTIGPK